jgi:hypothetical protein
MPTRRLRASKERENPDPLTIGLIVAGVVGAGAVGYLVYQRFVTPSTSTPATPSGAGVLTTGAWYSLYIPAGTQTLTVSTEVTQLQSVGSVTIVSQTQASNGDVTLVFQWNGPTGTAFPYGGFPSGGLPTLTQITGAQAQAAQAAAASNAEGAASAAAGASASANAGPPPVIPTPSQTAFPVVGGGQYRLDIPSPGLQAPGFVPIAAQITKLQALGSVTIVSQQQDPTTGEQIIVFTWNGGPTQINVTQFQQPGGAAVLFGTM